MRGVGLGLGFERTRRPWQALSGAALDIDFASSRTRQASATELVTNGHFTTDASGWTLSGSSGSSAVHGAGVVTLTKVGGGTEPGMAITPAITVVPGRRYLLVFDYNMTSVANSGTLYVNNPAYSQVSLTVKAGRHVQEFVAAGTSALIEIRIGGGGTAEGVATIDNVSVRELITENGIYSNPERIVNGGFDSDTVWAKKTPVGAETITISGGTLNLTHDGTNAAWADQAIDTVPGQLYVATLTTSGVSGLFIGTSQGGTQLYTNGGVSTGTTSHAFVATGAVTWVRVGRQSAGSITVDNVSVRPAQVGGERAPNTTFDVADLTGFRTSVTHLGTLSITGGRIRIELGTAVGQICVGDTAGVNVRFFTVVPGRAYRVQARFMGRTLGTPTGDLRVGPTNESTAGRANGLASGQLGVVYFTATTTEMHVGMFITGGSVGEIAEWDDLSVTEVTAISALPGLTVTRASPATSYAETSSGALVAFAANTARITDKGLLVEEARTNFILNSALLGALPIFPASGAFTDNGVDMSVRAPDGTMGMRKITVTSSGTFRVGDTASGTAGVAFTGSVYIKTADGATRSANLDVNDFGIIGVTITPDLRRLSTSGVNPAQVYRFFDMDLLAGEYHLWGIQLEQGAFATSFIPTAGAAVTRNEDVVTMLTSQVPGFSDTEGTIRTDGSTPIPLTPITNPAYISISDGTANELIYLRRTDSNGDPTFVLVDGGAVQAAISLSSTDIGSERRRLIGAWAANDAQGADNGALSAQDAVVTLPTLTTFRFAGSPGNGPLNGYLRRATYWNNRQSNANLQALTA